MSNVPEPEFAPELEQLLKQAAPLIDAWQDGTLAEDQKNELLGLIRQHPNLAETLRVDLALGNMLAEQFSERPDSARIAENVLRITAASGRQRVQAAVLAQTTEPPAPLTFPQTSVPQPYSSRWKTVAALVAAAVLSLILVSQFASQSEQAISIVSVSPSHEHQHELSEQRVHLRILNHDGELLVGSTRKTMTPLAPGSGIQLPAEIELSSGSISLLLPGADNELVLSAGTSCAISAVGSNIVVHRGRITGDLGHSKWLLTPHGLGKVQQSELDIAVTEQTTTALCLSGRSEFHNFSGDSQILLQSGQELKLSTTNKPAHSANPELPATFATITAMNALPQLVQQQQGTVSIATGQSHTFEVRIKDQFNEPMDHADLTSWVAVGGTLEQSVGAAVTFTAHEQGPARIIVHHAGLTSQLPIKIK